MKDLPAVSQSYFNETGVRRENRGKYVDMIAAVFILQGYLDAKANPGTV